MSDRSVVTTDALRERPTDRLVDVTGSATGAWGDFTSDCQQRRDISGGNLVDEVHYGLVCVSTY
jgi:hypothetical protein